MHRLAIVAATILAILAPHALAFTEGEHNTVTYHALARTSQNFPALPLERSIESFSRLAGRWHHVIGKRERHQVLGETPMAQLRALTVSDLEDYIDRARNFSEIGDDGVERFVFNIESGNSVSNYLIAHIIALDFAGNPDTPFERALEWEMQAAFFLADTFSSSYIMTPAHKKLAAVQSNNIEFARYFFRTQGAFVINGYGQAWQTFGDHVLMWYPVSYQKVEDALVRSMNELFLCRAIATNKELSSDRHGPWFSLCAQDRDSREVVGDWLTPADGPDYFSQKRLPGLISIPTPISATWSVRSGGRNADGKARRYHYPQLREPGLHNADDPRLDHDFLPSRTDVPDWMLAPALRDSSTAANIYTNPDVASVAYTQTRYVEPSYSGLIFTMGGGILKRGDESVGVLSGGLGHAWETLVPVAGSLRGAFEGEVSFPLNGDASAVIARTTGAVGMPGLPLFNALHLELGWAWTLEDVIRDDGFRWGIGVVTKPVHLDWTYAGMSVRLRYESFKLDNNLHGFQAILVFH